MQLNEAKTIKVGDFVMLPNKGGKFRVEDIETLDEKTIRFMLRSGFLHTFATQDQIESVLNRKPRKDEPS